MSKFDNVIESCKTQMKKIGTRADNELLEKIAKSLGPSIYNRDASLVATSQKTEMDNIRKKFIGKKLGVTDDKVADKAIEKAIDKIGRSNRHKLRVVFYYLLVKNLKKESVCK